MGNACSCCSKRERSVEDLLDGSLEDKLLGKPEDDEVTASEEEAWRQRREELKDEADMSMNSLDEDEVSGDNEDDNAPAALIWDLSDRNTVRAAMELVEDEEDEEAFGSAHEDATDEEANEEEDAAEGNEDINRLSQLSARSAADSYASVNDYFRGDTRVFRDTELRATEASDTFLTSTSPASTRDLGANESFLVDNDQDQQKEEQEEEDNDQPNGEKHRSNSGSSHKKKSRSRKSRK
ncbi:hypothetical protein PHMEG_0006030 [Phytophthora megakarya]|uniref:Uncharacterized protein n=1 Tax=Phytophthora megakarya TaxID=4795 RepID=A0A225WRL6_9STRA|nr:hypothetical protein PHMEG_0006030 [Phytophthora megakarya]